LFAKIGYFVSRFLGAVQFLSRLIIAALSGKAYTVGDYAPSNEYFYLYTGLPVCGFACKEVFLQKTRKLGNKD
jgi:hypothetical protein